MSRSTEGGDSFLSVNRRVAWMPSAGCRIRHREAARQGLRLAICMMAFLKVRSRGGEDKGRRKVRGTGERVERSPLFTYLF